MNPNKELTAPRQALIIIIIITLLQLQITMKQNTRNTTKAPAKHLLHQAWCILLDIIEDSERL